MVWILHSFLNHSRGQQEKGNTLCWERMRSLTNLIRHTKISYLIGSLLFRWFSCVTRRNGPHRGTSRLGILHLPQIVRAVLVKYLLPWIHILVYSCTECSTSKIYLCLEDNMSSFSRVSSKIRNYGPASINSHSLLLAKHMFFGKQKFDDNSWRWMNLYLTLNSWRWTNL